MTDRPEPVSEMSLDHLAMITGHKLRGDAMRATAKGMALHVKLDGFSMPATQTLGKNASPRPRS